MNSTWEKLFEILNKYLTKVSHLNYIYIYIDELLSIYQSILLHYYQPKTLIFYKQFHCKQLLVFTHQSSWIKWENKQRLGKEIIKLLVYWRTKISNHRQIGPMIWIVTFFSLIFPVYIFLFSCFSIKINHGLLQNFLF